MKHKISVSTALVLIIAFSLLTFQMTYFYVTGKYERAVYGVSSWQSLNSKFDEIDKKVKENTTFLQNNGQTSNTATNTNSKINWKDIYEKLAEVDIYARSSYVHEIDNDKLSDYVMSGYIYGLGDKYAAYLPKDEYKEYTLSTTEGSLVGIGIRITYDNTLGGMYITGIMPNTPAQEAGLLPGDIVVAVDGNSVNEKGYYACYNIIKEGKEGKPVTLTISTGASKNTETKDVVLTRKMIQKNTVEGKMLTENIALVKIYEFNLNTPDEFKKIIGGLQNSGATKYIFDVRNNPGGNLVGISEVLDFLLPEGPIIKVTSKTGAEQTLNSDANDLPGSMVVLMNESTASAGELFCAALRDYKKATLIGTKTFGKGTVQSIIPLSDGSGIKLSTQMYNPPYGDNYEGVGVSPDIECKMPEELSKKYYMITEDEDNQLQAAIEKIKAMD